MLLSPVFQGSGPKSFLLSSPEPLLTLLSMNRNSPGSPARVSHTCFMPTFEDNGRDFAQSNCSPLWNGFSTEDCQGGAQCMHAHAMMTSHEPDHTSASHQACDGSSQIHTGGSIEEGLRIQSLWNISQNAALVDQARRLQKRLSAMVGEHALQHYSQQIEGLRKKLLEISPCPKSPIVSDDLLTDTENVIFNDVRMQDGEEDFRRTHRYQTHRRSLKSQDVENLARCGRAVLHEVLESLDSDATLSSSSDEEWDHGDAEGTSAAPQCHSCEWRWLQDRAELGSRWTWLQMRLTELNSQIQQLGELHQQIIANKGRVILAKSQPLTDRQIQHTLWTETMDLSFSAGNLQDFPSDLDMEPSSPTRLLRNIERQSAQLTQIVNSLMPPLCPSPSSSPVTKEQQKISYSRQVQAYQAQCLDKPGRKRKQACHRRQWPLHLAATCVSARTRPLLTYHKPCLFIMDPLCHKEQVLDSFPSLCPSVSCGPTASCIDPTCPCRKGKRAGKMHSVLSLSSDTPSSFHLQNALCTEDFLQKSLSLKSDLFRPQPCRSSRCRVSRSLFYCNHRPKNSRYLKSHRRESTPIRLPCNPNHHRKPYREGKRKKCSSQWPIDVTQWSDQSDENLTEQCSEDLTDCRPKQQGNSQFSCRNRSAKIFTIDDIVIPMSLVSSVKVEKLQCKDIVTPSWRKVDIFPLSNIKKDEHPGESEPITDEDFSQRHKRYERREKRWSSSSQNRSNSIRSSRKSYAAVSVKDHPAYRHPPVDSPALSTRTSSPFEDQTEASVDDRESLLPWERRMFPLSDEDEEALRLHEPQSTTSGIGDQEMTSHSGRISALMELPKKFLYELI
ncbi:KAT8 regulatory NSL complex subunit 1-like protein isoform X2 [Paramisgurnus dabryanus]|uniref:KAT8 regulatory NSL complex subunit 1-like protein isoform X2 n=1 Tax=Paramisgurnus dabryanus TaxID=90735 RepID=UPI0031F38242